MGGHGRPSLGRFRAGETHRAARTPCRVHEKAGMDGVSPREMDGILAPRAALVDWTEEYPPGRLRWDGVHPGTAVGIASRTCSALGRMAWRGGCLCRGLSDFAIEPSVDYRGLGFGRQAVSILFVARSAAGCDELWRFAGGIFLEQGGVAWCRVSD